MFTKLNLQKAGSAKTMVHTNVKTRKVIFYNSLVVRPKGKSQNGCCKKTKHVKFSEKRTRTYQGVRNVRFSENVACFVFL